MSQEENKTEHCHKCLVSLSSVSAFLALGREKFAKARAEIDVDKNVAEALMRIDWADSLLKKECFPEAEHKLIRKRMDDLRDTVAKKDYYEGTLGFSDLADHIVRAMKEKICH